MFNCAEREWIMTNASGHCNRYRAVGALLLSLFLIGCEGSGAGVSGPRTGAIPQSYSPQPGKALVVFMRPSRRGVGRTPAIYDVTSGEPVFLGSIRSRTKIAYGAAPGQRRYMVAEETASFMDAELEAGKTYYVVVDTRSTFTTVDFLLRPIHWGKWLTEEFRRWDVATRWAVGAAAAENKSEYDLSNARRLQSEHLEEWLYRPGKATLRRRDGR